VPGAGLQRLEAAGAGEQGQSAGWTGPQASRGRGGGLRDRLRDGVKGEAFVGHRRRGFIFIFFVDPLLALPGCLLA
jgi:hypothetical protein